MIPVMNITAWARFAPWAEPRQIEQDLIISRALVELFGDEFLQAELRFRGGTALNKLHFPAPLRYSEDIDLVRTTHGPIKPLLRRLREILEPWLGNAEFEQSKVSPKLIFQADAEDGGPPLKLKVEINTRETAAFDEPKSIAYAVSNPWYSGEAAIPTFSLEEMAATKLRALLQRDKGRDLLDLSHALSIFPELDADRVAELLRHYLEQAQLTLSRAEAEERMFAKLVNPGFLADIRPLLPPAEAERLTDEARHAAFTLVFTQLIARMAGKPWAKSAEMAERYGLALPVE